MFEVCARVTDARDISSRSSISLAGERVGIIDSVLGGRCGARKPELAVPLAVRQSPLGLRANFAPRTASLVSRQRGKRPLDSAIVLAVRYEDSRLTITSLATRLAKRRLGPAARGC